MRKFTLLSTAAFLGACLLAVSGLSRAEDKAGKDLGKEPAKAKELKCPISGKPANAEFSLLVNGDSVAFCCNNCPKAYKKKLGVVDKGAAKCAACDKAGNAETSLIVQKGEMVFFCCNNCPKAWAKKHELAVKDEGPKLCAISGKPAVAEASLIINGESQYFCCKNCVKATLKKQGIKEGEVKVTACPLSGKPGKEETGQIHVTSEAVYFCCDGCRSSFVKEHFKGGKEKAGAEKKDKAEKTEGAK